MPPSLHIWEQNQQIAHNGVKYLDKQTFTVTSSGWRLLIKYKGSHKVFQILNLSLPTMTDGMGGENSILTLLFSSGCFKRSLQLHKPFCEVLTFVHLLYYKPRTDLFLQRLKWQ